jgi:hypothetical protein
MPDITVTEAGIKDGRRIFEVVVAHGQPEQRRLSAAAKMRGYARKNGLGAVMLVSQTNGRKRSRFFYSVAVGYGNKLDPIPLSMAEVFILMGVCQQELCALMENPQPETQLRVKALNDLVHKFHLAAFGKDRRLAEYSLQERPCRRELGDHE